MSCSPHDLRDYLFEELPPARHGEVRAHLKTCGPCRTELESLRATRTALLSLRDEEIPQRIGFVSDKVFEPSPLRRGFDGLWNSAARLGFVSAALLSAAILVHTVHNPAQNVPNSAQPAISQTEIDRRIDDAVAARVKAHDAQLQATVTAAVTQAVSEAEERAQKRTNALLAAAQRQSENDRWQLAVQADSNRIASIHRNLAMVRDNSGSAPQ